MTPKETEFLDDMRAAHAAISTLRMVVDKHAALMLNFGRGYKTIYPAELSFPVLTKEIIPRVIVGCGDPDKSWDRIMDDAFPNKPPIN